MFPDKTAICTKVYLLIKQIDGTDVYVSMIKFSPSENLLIEL